MSMVINDPARRLADLARLVARVVQNQCALSVQVALAPNVLVEIGADEEGMHCLVNVAHPGSSDEARRYRLAQQRRRDGRYRRDPEAFAREPGLFW